MKHGGLDARVHGARQLELTLLYPVRAESSRRRKEAYRLDLFVFTPYQLTITKERYPVTRFLSDLVSYTRQRTPQLELERLVDPGCAVSPLSRVRRLLAEREGALGADEGRIAYELRTLLNVYRSQTRDRRHAIRDALRSGALPPAEIERLCERLLEDMRAVVEAVRALAPLFHNAGIPDSLRESWRWADELVSVRSEKNFVRLYRDLAAAEVLPELQAELRRRVVREEEARAARGYDTVVDPNDRRQNELFAYRDGVLKKWSESSMYMTVSPSRSVSRVLQFLFGVAAALAMAFAVFASLLAARWFPEGSMSWALLAVLAYAFKDRIKEGLRGAFLRAVPRLVADRAGHLVDPQSGVRVGRTRERVSFPGAHDVPSDVRRIRYGRPDPLRALLPPEDVLHYHKDVRLDSNRMHELHRRTDALVEILRLDLRQWTERMDDPEQQLAWFDGEDLSPVGAERVYHLNVVVRLASAEDGPEGPAFYRHRLVVTRRGILRVEPVEG